MRKEIISSAAIRLISRSCSPDTMTAQAPGVSSHGQRTGKSLRTRRRSVTWPPVSTPVPETSPSPITACISPIPNSAPGWWMGRYTVVPVVTNAQSRFPPWDPGTTVEIAPSRGATPMTPSIGLTGSLRDPQVATLASIRTSRVRDTRTRSPRNPMPGVVTVRPCGPGRRPSMSTASVSPGAAPRTKIGPVAGLTRFRSMSVNRVSSSWI